MKLTVLSENNAPSHLVAEHGLSFWIETAEGNVLFDTGQGPAFVANIERLNIPLESALAIVLSHGHYDHTGGIPYVVERNKTAPIYFHPDALDDRYSIASQEARHVGLPEAAQAALKREADRIRWTAEPTNVLTTLHVTGVIPRRTDYEDTGGPFYLDPEAQIPDPLWDDQALWIDTPKGLIIVLGCAHSGVINTIDYICSQAGKNRIYAIAGGMHLISANGRRLEMTLTALKKRNITYIAPCHCTGDNAIAYLKRHLADRVIPCEAGTVLDWSA